MTCTGATPFSLVYGMEDVTPIVVEFPCLRLLMEVELEKTRYEQLNMIEEVIGCDFLWTVVWLEFLTRMFIPVSSKQGIES